MVVRRGRLRSGAHPPGTPGDPLTQMARCANGEVESPPGGGSGGAKRHAPPAPVAAVRLRQSPSAAPGGSGEIFEADGRRCVLQAASARRVEKLVRGGLLLLSGWVLGVDSERAGGHALGGGVVDHARGRGMW